MKKIILLLSLLALGSMVNAGNMGIAPYLQDSDAKVKYVLVRREAYNALVMAIDALNRASQKDMQSVIKQLDGVRTKLKNVIASPVYTNVYQNFTQTTRDREDMELYVEKIDSLKAKLLDSLNSLKVKPFVTNASK